MHVPLRGTPQASLGIFGPNSGYIAHYAPFIWPKSPTNCDAHLPESNFQTRSSVMNVFSINIEMIWFHQILTAK